MNPCRQLWPVFGLVVLLSNETVGQGPIETFEQLLRQLEQSDAVRGEELIDSFISERPQGDPDGVRARLVLASNRLRSLSLWQALTEYQEAVSVTPPGHRELFARGLYGKAQCEELLGREEDCQATLERLVEDYADLRYARFARVTLQRLQSARTLRVGLPAPRFGPVLDTTGRAHSLASRLSKPTLMLFLDPANEKDLAETTRVLQAFHRGGGDPSDVLLFAFHGDLRAVRSVAGAQGWNMPIFLCNGAFLEPVVLQFSVHSLPASFLVGPDGVLLQRNPTPGELQEAIDLLVGG